MRQVLHEAGGRLADALRQSLAAQGLAGTLEVAMGSDRLRVVGRGRDIHVAETGRAGIAPTAPMESAARAAAPGIAHALAVRLRAGVQ